MAMVALWDSFKLISLMPLRYMRNYGRITALSPTVIALSKFQLYYGHDIGEKGKSK